jgi:hypothetical protein
VLLAGGHPYVLLDAPGVKDLLLRTGNDDQLRHTNPYRLMALEKSDAVLDISSEENTRATNNIAPARQALTQQASKPFGALGMARIIEGRPRCLTLFPTNAYAQDAEMSLSEFEDFVFHACLLDGDEEPASGPTREREPRRDIEGRAVDGEDRQDQRPRRETEDGDVDRRHWVDHDRERVDGVGIGEIAEGGYGHKSSADRTALGAP